MKEKIQEDLKEALRKKDKRKLRVLRLLLNEIFNRERQKRYQIAKKRGITEIDELEKLSLLDKEEIFKVISSEINKRKEAIKNFQKANRAELIEEEQKEIDILKSYLPPQLPEEEVEKIVRETINSLSAQDSKDVGRVMKEVLKKIEGRADAFLVSLKVKKILLKKE